MEFKIKLSQYDDILQKNALVTYIQFYQMINLITLHCEFIIIKKVN